MAQPTDHQHNRANTTNTTPPRYNQDTVNTLNQHGSRWDTTETPPRHHRDTTDATKTPPRHHRRQRGHHRDIIKTPSRQYRDTTETWPRHHRDTTATPPRPPHHRDTAQAGSRKPDGAHPPLELTTPSYRYWGKKPGRSYDVRKSTTLETQSWS